MRKFGIDGWLFQKGDITYFVFEEKNISNQLILNEIDSIVNRKQKKSSDFNGGCFSEKEINLSKSLSINEKHTEDRGKLIISILEKKLMLFNVDKTSIHRYARNNQVFYTILYNNISSIFFNEYKTIQRKRKINKKKKKVELTGCYEIDRRGRTGINIEMDVEYSDKEIELISNLYHEFKNIGFDVRLNLETIENLNLDVVIYHNSKPMFVIMVEGWKHQNKPNPDTRKYKLLKRYNIPVVYIWNSRVIPELVEKVMAYYVDLVSNEKEIDRTISDNVDKTKERKGGKKSDKDILEDDIEKWSANHFLVFMHRKFTKRYGLPSLEFNRYASLPIHSNLRGKLYGIIKRQMILFFRKEEMTNDDLRDFIIWMFEIKSVTFKNPLSLRNFCDQSIMNEWRMVTSKKVITSKLSRQQIAKSRRL